jgi:hypothetical protein
MRHAGRRGCHLNGCRPTELSPESKEELLRREMAAIGGLLVLEVAREPDRERAPKGNADPYPQLERRRRTFTALELSVPGARAPDSDGHLLLGQP